LADLDHALTKPRGDKRLGDKLKAALATSDLATRLH
jgi:hypothetical protein